MKFSMLVSVRSYSLSGLLRSYFIHPPKATPRSNTELPFESTTCVPSTFNIPEDMMGNDGGKENS